MDGKLIYADDDVSIAELEDEWVVLQVGSGKYYTLNEVGIQIFRYAKGGISIDDLVDKLVDHYSIKRSRLESDVQKFVGEMEKFGLIDATQVD